MKSGKKLLRFLKPYWYWALLAPLLMMGEVGLDLVQPRLIERIVDVGLAQNDLSIVLNTGFLMIGVALAAAVAGVGCTVFAVLASEAFGADVRSTLFRKVQSLSFANVDALETGSLVTRLTNDVDQVQNAVATLLRIMVRGPVMMIGSLVMAILTGPELAPLFLVLMPLVAIVVGVIIHKAFPLFKQVQGKVDGLNTVMQESLMGVRVVKAFVRGEHEEVRFADANDELMALAIKAARTVALGWPLLMLILQVGIAAVLWFGGVRVVEGSMQLGQIIAFINYLLRTLMSMVMVTMLIMHISRAEASAQRIDEVLESEPVVKNRPAALKTFPTTFGAAAATSRPSVGPGNGSALGLSDELSKPAGRDGQVGHNGDGVRPLGRVTFENVTFGYDGDDHQPVLNGLSFAAEPGQTVAILGATGAGKSSLIHLIPRFYDVQEGRVTLDGVDVRDLDKELLRRNVAVALQEPLLFSGTIRDNIRYGRPDASDVEVEAAARMARAHDFIVEFPEGYDTILGQRGVNLSGGQKQRLAIARALLVDPAVLILDDSTSSVDVETEAEIQAELAEFVKARGEQPRTTFIVAQRISTVLTADKILVLDGGAVAAEGTHSELLSSSDIYREIYDSQLGEGVMDHG